MKIELDISIDEAARLLEATQYYDDRGLPEEGYQSQELKSLAEKIIGSIPAEHHIDLSPYMPLPTGNSGVEK